MVFAFVPQCTIQTCRERGKFFFKVRVEKQSSLFNENVDKIATRCLAIDFLFYPVKTLDPSLGPLSREGAQLLSDDVLPVTGGLCHHPTGRCVQDSKLSSRLIQLSEKGEVSLDEGGHSLSQVGWCSQADSRVPHTMQGTVGRRREPVR